jgi:purine-binding chemotaxis protein CheW
MAQRSAEAVVATATEERMQLVTFMLGEEEYGFPIMSVDEIIRMRNVNITHVPNAPDFVEGVINLRGRIIPVVDLRARFGMPAAERGRTNRIVVADADRRTVGAVVDEVVEVLTIASDGIEPVPDLAVKVGSDYVAGVTRVDDRMVLVLDMSRVFSSEEKACLDAVTA